MHALHLPSGHLWKSGMLALGLTLVALVLGALVAPAVLDLSRPTVTTAAPAGGEPATPPAWKTDPLAPPPLLNAR